MVEMLQNIIHHGTADANNLTKPGIFFIKENEDEYLLHAGNYVRNEKVPSFQKKLKNVNQLSSNELNEFYDTRLFDFMIDSPTGAGLGIIDMRLKSQNKLIFSFHEIDDRYNFFILQTNVVKRQNEQ